MSPSGYRFGPFRLDMRARRLLRGDEAVALTPKAFDALLLLVEGRGGAFRRTDLIARLWPDRVVEEANLTQTVFTLRKALGDDVEPYRYIETVPRYGYRFVAEVAEADGQPAAAPGPAAPRTRLWVRLLVLGGLALTLAAVAAWLTAQRRPWAPRLLAVLPFEDGSAGGGWQYVADGVTEGIINRAARMHNLRVLARTTSFRYQGRQADAQRAGRELGVEQLVTGRVTVREGRVEVQADLLQVSTGTQLWGRRMVAGFDGLESLEQTIVDELAQQLGAAPAGDNILPPKRVKPEAQRLYLEARYFWNRRTPEGLRKSLALFEAALALQPDYAPALAGVADVNSLLPEYAGVSGATAYPAAREAARRALDLDDSLAEAHTSLAFVRFWWERDREAALAGFRRAIELNPSYATAHHWYGNALLAEGRPADAVAAIRAAHDLDPLSMIIASELGAALYYARSFGEAARHLRHALELDSSFAPAHFWLGRALLFSGRIDEALAEYDRTAALMGTTTPILAERGYALALRGDGLGARHCLSALDERPPQPGHAFNRAILHVALGEREQALAWLSRARAEREIDLAYVGLDPLFDQLRGDPAFTALLRDLSEPRRR